MMMSFYSISYYISFYVVVNTGFDHFFHSSTSSYSAEGGRIDVFVPISQG